ncbi:MAG TPA: AAA family ATPase, partial [Pyrinomonadaceae bacterium]|nr:AAA family ATPase [Pyrinomonadaceae bacterium]
MFKLRRLEITGFKSFADHTDLIFTGEGITAVVGPNGCGKSNVADAIAWVLGEQRVKHLRGADMKDVIFQGSRNRPPSGMSEVILHLVRDEYVECEPDIEDIDSTLEQIDEHAEVFEAVESMSEPGAVATGSDNSTGQSASLVIQGEHLDPVATAPGSDTDAPATPDALPDQAKPKQPHHRHWRRRNLALEFAPGEAVSVTRRLYRSGESE